MNFSTLSGMCNRNLRKVVSETPAISTSRGMASSDLNIPTSPLTLT